jgi:hypothetical protein
VTDASRAHRCSWIAVAPACLGLITGLSACGGGSHAVAAALSETTITRPGSPQALTVAQFRAKASAICLKLYRAKVPKGTAGLAAMLPALRAADSSLEALKPPPSLAKLDKGLVADEKRIADFLPTLAKAAKNGNHAVLLHVLFTPRFIQASSKEEKLWTAIGSKACASGPLAKYTR